MGFGELNCRLRLYGKKNIVGFTGGFLLRVYSCSDVVAKRRRFLEVACAKESLQASFTSGFLIGLGTMRSFLPCSDRYQ